MRFLVSGRREEKPAKSRFRRAKGGIIWETIKFAVIVGLIVVPIRIYIAQPFIVNGLSMYPTLNNGDYLIIDELSYNFLREPGRGEVIVFRPPLAGSRFFIKRVIGLPGEMVEIKDGGVYVGGEKLAESYHKQVTGPDGSWTLKDSEYFVMGDNRGSSSDSRFWGVLPEENIVGRAFLRLWPITEAAYLPGQ